jgi:hypothetical protein
MNKCQTCNTKEAMTEATANAYRADGWAGIDFYNPICTECFDLLKEER